MCPTHPAPPHPPPPPLPCPLPPPLSSKPAPLLKARPQSLRLPPRPQSQRLQARWQQQQEQARVLDSTLATLRQHCHVAQQQRAELEADLAAQLSSAQAAVDGASRHAGQVRAQLASEVVELQDVCASLVADALEAKQALRGALQGLHLAGTVRLALAALAAAAQGVMSPLWRGGSAIGGVGGAAEGGDVALGQVAECIRRLQKDVASLARCQEDAAVAAAPASGGAVLALCQGPPTIAPLDRMRPCSGNAPGKGSMADGAGVREAGEEVPRGVPCVSCPAPDEGWWYLAAHITELTQGLQVGGGGDPQVGPARAEGRGRGEGGGRKLSACHEQPQP